MVTGEAEIIARYLAPLAVGHPGALELRDDAAVLTPPPGYEVVATMDAVAAGVHFLPDDPPADVAWKALAVNVSDLVAKGAEPHAYLMSLAFPEPPSERWLTDFAAGLAAAQDAFAITLVGGDTDRRPGPLSVTITALGLVPAGRMVQRTTARAGDRIVVTGPLGGSALGLAVRTGQPHVAAWGLDADQRRAIEGAYLRPDPRPAIAPILRVYASAAMDISDGLMKDLDRMACACGLSAEVIAARLPVMPEVRAVLTIDPSAIVDVATGGDDYCVLAAVSPDNVAHFVAAAAAVGIVVTEIGGFGQGAGVRLMDGSGAAIDIARLGYDHFAGLPRKS
jgi:thiamine-monophosphate kinase